MCINVTKTLANKEPSTCVIDTRLPCVAGNGCSFRRNAVLRVLPLGRRISSASGVSAVGPHSFRLPSIVVGPAAAEVDDDAWFLDRLQCAEAGSNDFVLIFGIEGEAGRMAEGIVDEHRARWIAGGCNVIGAGEGDRRCTGGFEMAGDQTHGLMAYRSHGYEQDRVDRLCFELCCQVRDQFLTHPALGIDATHAGQGFVCHRADKSFIFETLQGRQR